MQIESLNAHWELNVFMVLCYSRIQSQRHEIIDIEKVKKKKKKRKICRYNEKKKITSSFHNGNRKLGIFSIHPEWGMILANYIFGESTQTEALKKRRNGIDSLPRNRFHFYWIRFCSVIGVDEKSVWFSFRSRGARTRYLISIGLIVSTRLTWNVNTCHTISEKRKKRNWWRCCSCHSSIAVFRFSSNTKVHVAGCHSFGVIILNVVE